MRYIFYATVFLIQVAAWGRETGTLVAPVQLSIMREGKVVGSVTAPAGSVVTVVTRAATHLKIAMLAGEAWVDESQVKVDSSAPAPSPTAKPASTPVAKSREADSRFKDDLRPGEAVVFEAGERIEDAGRTSAWQRYAAAGSAATRARALVCDSRTSAFRAILHKDGAATQAFELPTPAVDSNAMYLISGRDLNGRWGAATADTFYVAPTDFKRYGMDVVSDFIKVGTGKMYRGIVITTPDPNARPAPGAATSQIAAKYAGGLTVSFVAKFTKNPANVSPRDEVTFNYRLSFVPETTNSTITVEGGYAHPKSTVFERSRYKDDLIPDGMAREYSIRQQRDWEPTAHVVRFNFKGRGKATLSVWNIRDGSGGEPSKADSQNDIPDGDETAGGFGADAAKQVILLVNAARRQEGLPELVENEDLTRAAAFHASSMEKEGYFSHDSFRKKEAALVRTLDACSRISRFYASPDSEIIAKKFSHNEPQAVFDAWIKESGTRDNILSKSAGCVGVAVRGGNWVMDFGTGSER